ISKAKFWDIFNSGLDLIEPMNELVKKLKTRKFQVFILSNTNHVHARYIRENYSFMDAADGFVLSCEIGLRKPDPEYFKYALKLAKVNPENALFIDDIEKNVEGARSVGIKSILCKEPESLAAHYLALL
ncbi:HAD family hydrolase, partial [Elusimicrobiota bacterium]